MRTRLRATSPTCSPECALAKLRRIQHHRVSISAAKPVARLSSIDREQAAILAALDLKKPTLNTQLTPL